MDQRIIDLYDEYTHAPLPRREFMKRLAVLVGSVAAAEAILPLLAPSSAAATMVAPDDARLVSERVSYPGASGTMQGYFAKPKDASAKSSAVVVIHENRGLNPHIEDVARRAALEGFLALAPDALSPLGGTPSDPDKARDLIGQLDGAKTIADYVAAVDYLKSRPDCNGKIGSVGFCWGGGMSNQLAVHSPVLRAAVAFYGRQPDAADAKRIKAQLLLHYAGLDERINAGVPAWETALKEARVRYRLHMYDGVNHAFHNDTSEARYNKEAAELAWDRTMGFFNEALNG